MRLPLPSSPCARAAWRRYPRPTSFLPAMTMEPFFRSAARSEIPAHIRRRPRQPGLDSSIFGGLMSFSFRQRLKASRSKSPSSVVKACLSATATSSPQLDGSPDGYLWDRYPYASTRTARQRREKRQTGLRRGVSFQLLIGRNGFNRHDLEGERVDDAGDHDQIGTGEITAYDSRPTHDAIGTSPDSSAATAVGPPGIKSNSTSRPCFLKMPASLVIHIGVSEPAWAL